MGKTKAQNALIHVKGEIVYDRHIAQKIATAFVTIYVIITISFFWYISCREIR
ncbi:MAG: hypothetical protein ACLUQB_13665 [Lachnospiraceae bacterium]